MELKFSTHAQRRLQQRYKLNLEDVKSVKLEVLSPDEQTYWVVLNGRTDAIAVVKNGVVVTMLSMWHKLSQKTFGKVA